MGVSMYMEFCLGVSRGFVISTVAQRSGETCRLFLDPQGCRFLRFAGHKRPALVEMTNVWGQIYM